jgi:hypothetical protein
MFPVLRALKQECSANFALTEFSEVRCLFLDLEMHTATEGVGKRHRLTDVEPHPAGPESRVRTKNKKRHQASRETASMLLPSGSSTKAA